MRRLVILAILLLASSPLSFAQSGISGPTVVVGFAGVPSGTCSVLQFAVNTTNGNVYSCNGGTWTIVSGGGGPGTVTSFSAGTLSPLFTTSVATPTTTPALSFTLSNAAAGTLLGNPTGSAAAPVYTATPVLGLAGTTLGTLTLSGNAGGSVLITPQATAGSPTLTLPNTTGTFAVGASSPLVLSATTGNLTCTTCATTATGGAVKLSDLAAANATNTTANGNNPQLFNFAQTTDAQAGWTIGETSAATGGTITNAFANQSNLTLSTASNSTATPLNVSQGSITNTVATPMAQFSATWNNASLVGEGFLLNLTNTASNAFSKWFDIRINGVSQMSMVPNGNVIFAGAPTIAGTATFQGANAINLSAGVSAIIGSATTNVMTIGCCVTTSGATYSGGLVLGRADYTGTGGGSSGYVIIHSGEATGATGANIVPPLIERPGLATSTTAVTSGREAGDGYIVGGGTTTLWNLQCMTATARTVNDCATSSAMPEGVATGTATPLLVIRDGWIPINADGAVTIGHTVCTSTTVAGQIHDSGGVASCVVGTNVGRVVATSGTVDVTNSTGLAITTATLSTTLPFISLRID